MVDKKKILIAEDEKPMAKALELKLNNSGFEAKAVFDGLEAVAALQDGNYDLMLLDLVMPNLDGFGVLEEAQRLDVSTKIIVASNLSQEEDFKRAKELGAVDYFVKSNTSLAQIVDQVQKALGV